MSHVLGPTAHSDTFARDNLPPVESWPVFNLEKFQYPEYLNAGVELTDRMVEQGFGDNTALIGNGRQRTYKELSDWTNRIAHALAEDYGVKPGNRILIRSANNPAMVACWLAATKAGAVVVNTMPMLRAGELAQIVDKAEIEFALCDTRLMDELVACAKDSRFLKKVIGFDGTANHDAELDRIALTKSVKYEAVKTGRDDVALLGFTSGTTGEPKATMHFHRDLLIIADGYAREVLNVTPDDVFVGSPPLAFTFGLGGLAVFPLRFGATATLLEKASPPNMIEIIETYKATVCFTAPTAYRAMLAAMDDGADLSSLRAAVSAGETLPAPVYKAWMEKTGKPMLDGIGATEMLHIFISNRFGDSHPACTGRPVGGYEARIVDDEMNELPIGTIGKLAVRGPTGCRYLADDRQHGYVRDGWNLTGDAFFVDSEGYFHFAARNDDMIVSSGYNIAGPEVEAALLSHPDVAECAVVAAADEERGYIVQAHVVLTPNANPSPEMAKLLQDHVKATIAPYKYPRSILFIEALPKTATGKIQRFRLKQEMSA
ncbi:MULTISPECIES: AMP-binding protein [Thalassospira]|jgi:2-aminobenzoate-CoA ligase|uniref:2-aminobenzoate-CoA ligase n=1 Tax=Thalassospira xiamenensis TaxID=220697 RepID=A0ABR5XXC7_9PROT|nr:MULTISPECIES: AMP-binding protein [Thalassospira]MAL29111.1 2-aminobenzoate-CoA ligase [Thalassospira sp.]MBR9780201.1 AMP-binding protein [Rhodospirillales bacterium]KZC99533.1 2-aminobenzoate-CoA ligase [Thalassospira xiamenensis]KZD05666.1 2-aminobenzoate-CoA ligase [Thalassospira xiamenensis]MBR9815326.1 AMP-binding protein [Rhodospirillales bacterium]|tara:strand:+ start:33696 stop:35330 length:1635 start_codon:yes stop_codon:yes gene_type:complete